MKQRAKKNPRGDYSLIGKDSALAVVKGLAEARWYASPIPKDQMRALLERRDGPALRDTLLWFALLFITGAAGYLLRGSPWAILPFALYGVLYASTSDSRWHESSHGTAFKTDWLNNALYEIASFMVLRESTPWRWSHTRHHSDTIVVGRDPEIAVQRPAQLLNLVLNFFNIPAFRKYWQTVPLHLAGRLSPEELTYIPASALPGIRARAWIYVLVYAAVIALSVATRSILPLLYIGLPTFYGAWLMVIYGYTQHAGLAENVLDHRLNCRTVYMHAIHRYLYWNMNYHVEHHMFPLVPYHALPKLHALIKADCPPAYPGILAAYREIIPTVLRQATDPDFFVRRPLPAPRAQSAPVIVFSGAGKPVSAGWIDVCASSQLGSEDVVRFDHEQATFAVYRTAAGRLYATEGVCTHSSAHLADGMLKGSQIECAKHNGRFDVRDGSPQRAPVCVALKTYAVRESGGMIQLNLLSAGGLGVSAPPAQYTLRVVSNENASAFIKELILEAEPGALRPDYTPGQYLQFDIPAYPPGTLASVEVPPRFRPLWEQRGAFALPTANPLTLRRNYSMASNPAAEEILRFNIRLAVPPAGTDAPVGAGSAYLFNLKPGDRLQASGPFGAFTIRPGTREMIYLGGGAGMAPLRAHIVHLLETQASPRRISYWYGARSRQELFYQDDFAALAARFPNFSFHPALSEPLPADAWDGPTGLIHQALKRGYLDAHPDPRQVDYYLCGPPAMILAARIMLAEIGVGLDQVFFDEF
jgi:MocE subfamily Rieske [2Fe-2S] domain protein